APSVGIARFMKAPPDGMKTWGSGARTPAPSMKARFFGTSKWPAETRQFRGGRGRRLASLLEKPERSPSNQAPSPVVLESLTQTPDDENPRRSARRARPGRRRGAHRRPRRAERRPSRDLTDAQREGALQSAARHRLRRRAGARRGGGRGAGPEDDGHAAD